MIVYYLMSLWSLHSVLQVILIGQTVAYFTPGSILTVQDAYISSVGVILCSALKSLIFTAYDINTSQMGMQIRVSICSAIYRKVDRCYVLFLLFGASHCAFVVFVLKHKCWVPLFLLSLLTRYIAPKGKTNIGVIKFC